MERQQNTQLYTKRTQNKSKSLIYGVKYVKKELDGIKGLNLEGYINFLERIFSGHDRTFIDANLMRIISPDIIKYLLNNEDYKNLEEFVNKSYFYSLELEDLISRHNGIVTCDGVLDEISNNTLQYKEWISHYEEILDESKNGHSKKLLLKERLREIRQTEVNMHHILDERNKDEPFTTLTPSIDKSLREIFCGEDYASENDKGLIIKFINTASHSDREIALISKDSDIYLLAKKLLDKIQYFKEITKQEIAILTSYPEYGLPMNYTRAKCFKEPPKPLPSSTISA